MHTSKIGTVAIIKFWTSFFCHKYKKKNFQSCFIDIVTHEWWNCCQIYLQFVKMSDDKILSLQFLFIYFLLIKTSFYSICLIFKTSWMLSVNLTFIFSLLTQQSKLRLLIHKGRFRMYDSMMTLVSKIFWSRPYVAGLLQFNTEYDVAKFF
jgi:hypothetical protein